MSSNKNIKPPHTYKDRIKTCSECGVSSMTVNKSMKYNKNLCLDCLKELILASNKDTE